ncbi:unnamed protein product [Schistosoma margrebowiei]|uniref:Protein FAR1-RELATED SEQUENCE n=1 Tax=Schistosoma margrebowiei TaxID=48269 RepID=A0AA85A251_9TREM|nr:unnamed protein product [Schistosoma margrebowiei]
MSDNVHSSSNEDDAIVMMHDIGGIFNDTMLSRRFTSWDNFETFLKEVHKYSHTNYVMSVCKKNSDDPTSKYFFVRYVCTYGRKRSSSESDACVQDVDDDSNNHHIFTRKYEHLRTHFPRAYNYIKDYWIARRSMWARCYRRHVLSLGNHTNNRVESAHKHLKECLRRGDSLLLTFWKIWIKTDITIRLRSYDAVKDLLSFPILQVPMSFRTLLNEFTSFAAKIVAVNYKRVRTMRHEFIEGE